MSFAPIAIVGRSCILPGALSPQALWQLVRSSSDEISAVPEGRWRAPAADLLCAPGAGSADKSWSDRGGYVRGFDDVWDASGFALPASELDGLDPLFLWSLHCARQALNEAGDARLGVVDRSRVGAVFGNLGFPSAGMTEFAESRWLDDTAAVDPRNRFGSSGAAALLEQALGLAPGVTCLDTACASSLYAIKMACDQLHDGEHDLVLAGAVNRADDLFIHVGFTALNAMSRSGQSRPFNAHADGLVPAEGAGFVALKRLADARRDGNTIFGVIRGIGLSNDGRSGGFLAPAEEGQKRALAQAYKGSGLSPADVGMLECHATGTSVGDAAEIRSSSALFDGLSEVPIGSLKSNMGHLITAAGVAGLIKLLEAMRHQERPPSLHSEPLNPVLENTPFRVLREVENWPSEKPRVAALSAFGFGGNNAHLVVSEDDSSLVAPELDPVQYDTVAIIAAGAVVGPCNDRPQLLRSLLAKESLVGPQGAQTGEFELALKGLCFPPRDLQAALGQQVVLLKAAREAMAQQKEHQPERSAVYLGMEPDVEVCRFGLRWRLAEHLRRKGLDPVDHEAWLQRASDLIVPTLEAAGVVGNMPNIPANRLNSQFDFGAGSWSVSSGRASGLTALSLAQRALSVGEVDVAMVAAVDLSCEPVHLGALGQIEGDRRAPGDAAVVLLLKRASDAEAAGDEILALLDPKLDKSAKSAVKFEGLLGDSFAAGGLRDLFVSALLAAAEAQRSGEAQSRSIDTSAPLTLRSHDRPGSMLSRESSRPAGPSKRFSAHPQPIALTFPETEPNSMHSEGQTMQPAPELAPVHTSKAFATPAPQQRAPVVAPLAVASASLATAPSMHPTVAAFSQQLQAMTLAENEHIALQTSLHEQFLQLQTQAIGLLVDQRSTVQPSGDNLRRPSSVVDTSPTKPAPAALPAAPITPAKQAPDAAPMPTGPSFTRAQLETHASGNISEIYGERFRPQDSFRRQVRMPEPPLLLADRVTGLDAELGSMGLGTIWSETDVQKDAWYMHQGHMPAGIMIESGQADLMLISYLGVDFTNRNDRVYRLLGCELTYSRGLPQAGDTLSYDIHMDGHATQGDVRLMFFHYDCRINGEIRLRVRQGQAGFFTDQELAESDGCLWRPEDE
ncbi:MAG: beta-ketoacyl synthase N-terminal-like domain-containing protein, partial [Myxococcota bacterium]|nr:beta-ketoacyl synthase N-terminal-like domain-containing protein [Myxococcota bacterium]